MRERASWSFKFMSGLAAVGVAASGLAGCIVPELAASSSHDVKKQLFYAVVRGVQCEIREAVDKQVTDYPRKLAWLKDWSALMHFTFTFDTSASFNPGVSLLTPNLPFAHLWRAPDLFVDPTTPDLVKQSYQFGVGAGLSGSVKRVEDVEFFYPFNKDFFKRAEKERQDVKRQGCYHLGGLTIGGDLKLYEWLDDVLEPLRRCAFRGVPSSAPPTTVPVIDLVFGSERDEPPCPDDLVLTQGYSADAPLRTLSHDVTFTITFSAHATPQWTLVRIATGSGPLFDARRNDIFDLKITMGAPKRESTYAWSKKGDRVHYLPARGVEPSEEMRNRDLSLQIGSAVRDALQR